MFEKYIRAFKFKSFLVFVMIHLGLVLSVYGLATLPRDESAPHTFWILLAGIGGLYGGIALGAFFILWPLAMIVSKIRQFLNWREWILRELPQILALIPTLLEAFRNAKASWSGGGTDSSTQPAPAPQAPAPPAPSHQDRPAA